MVGTKKVMEGREPERLVRGKQFHKNLQREWEKGFNRAQGEKVTHEEKITKPSGRKGRIDIFVNADDNLMAIVEIKSTDWDKMTLEAVRRNFKRQANQIWHHIESQLEQDKDVSPGIIFPERPKNPVRLRLVEALFGERGIPVVWQDESKEERKART
jgi:hypothetical protein